MRKPNETKTGFGGEHVSREEKERAFDAEQLSIN